MTPNHSDILFSRLPNSSGHIGRIVLNRPAQLNALTQAMCAALHRQLTAWECDDTIQAVMIQGAGEKAFCAGGDIRSLYQHGRQHAARSVDFFRVEYAMNQAIYHFKKPYLAFLDGLTFGGGAGVSLHGSHPIATERFLFSMPETGIGFFPDIGAGYFLNQCPAGVGAYLGLTGARLQAGDAKALGLVSQVVAHADQAAVIEALCEADLSQAPFERVSAVLAAFESACEPGPLMAEKNAIATLFSHATVELMLSALSTTSGDWARQTKTTLQAKSPTSLKVTLAQLQRAQCLDFDAVMQMELGIAARFMQTPDFYEGVRAAVIDKDHRPHWQPVQLESVTAELVQSFFEGCDSSLLKSTQRSS
jgi:enoyl-CoA hydratase